MDGVAAARGSSGSPCRDHRTRRAEDRDQGPELGRKRVHGRPLLPQRPPAAGRGDRTYFEDQLSSEKKCGHLGGKVLVPTGQFIRTLVAARLAADVAAGRRTRSCSRRKWPPTRTTTPPRATSAKPGPAPSTMSPG